MAQTAVNGIELYVEDAGDGAPVLLLHGFPDSGQVWRHQAAALRAAGWRTVVPDLRGFGRSSRPAATAAYRLPVLLGDVLGLMDALGIRRAHLVCHDWGASLGWLLAAQHAERFASLAALSVGHPQCFYGGGISQREKSWYMLLFQFEQVAERALAADDWALFRDFARHHCECERWIADLARPGALTAALAWYRANTHPAQTFRRLAFPRVPLPVLGLWGAGDPYLTEAQMAGSGALVDGHWRYRRIEGAGHWLQLDRPRYVSDLLCSWLADVAE